jgi:dUTP pyrophosphatase
MKVAQMVITPVIRVEVEEVDSLSSTLRGTGGFGSTGITANV